MFGAKNEEEFISHGPWELSPERQPGGRASSEKAKEMIETAVREGSHFFEWTHRRIGGEEFPADVLLTRMERDGKVFLQATVRDITERKNAEAAVQESEKKYRLLVEQSVDGIIVADQQWNIQFVNPAICRMLGYTPEELCQLNIAETGIPEERDRVARERQALRGGSIVRYERTIRKKDGSCFPVEVIIGELGDGRYQEIVRDISERRQSEQRLHMQDAALNAAANAIAITDPQGTILWINPAFTTLTGYTREEIIGTNPRVLKSGEHDAAFYAELWRTIKAGNIWHGELVNRRKDGSLYTEEMTITPVRNAAGEISHFIAIMQDVTEWKLTEESRRHFAAIVEHSDDAIISAEVDGTLTSWNAAAQRLYNYAAEEILGRSISVLVPRNRMGELREILGKLQSGEHIQHLETVRLKKGGIPVDVSITVSPVKNDAGQVTGVSAIIRDITERKRAQEALHKSEAHYRALVETTNTGFVVIDYEGKVLDANAEYVRLTGHRDLNEIRGRSVIEWTAAHEKEKNAEAVKRCVEQGFIRAMEIDYVDSRGNVTPIEFDATVVETGGAPRILTLCRDITEHKRAEEALRALSAYTRSLIEASLDPLVTIGPEGKITDVNAATETATGRNRTELIGTDFSDYFTDPEQAKAGYRKVFREGSVRDYPLELRHSDGSIISVLYNASVYHDAAGNVVGAFAAARDITERKRAENALQETNLQLQQALTDLKNAQEQVIRQERLSALGAMASGIAHDFNNSLTAILGGSELLLSGPEHFDDKEKARNYIEMMNTAAQDAGNVVNRLREFYRHREERDVFIPVNISDVVGHAVALTQPKWKAEAEVRGVSVNVHTDLQEVPPVAGNAANLREVLTNLIFNAVDAMPRGGAITIHTYCDDGYVVLKVGDTGTGMTEGVRQRCLEPFFTTKGERGTGLGLSMVYGIIQRHQGTIDIETEVGKGTTFIIRLPVLTAQPRSEPKAQPVDAVQPLHVLVVDDEAVVRKILGEYLKLDGHIMEAANSGRDGLEKFRNSRFDLVLVDRAMPDMSGDQVATAIKSADPKVPVVMLTGFGSMMDAADEKPAGVDLVLGKPVTINELRTALSKVVASVN
jgi:PAS domain S-box-containing protein